MRPKKQDCGSRHSYPSSAESMAAGPAIWDKSKQIPPSAKSTSVSHLQTERG